MHESAMRTFSAGLQYAFISLACRLAHLDISYVNLLSVVMLSLILHPIFVLRFVEMCSCHGSCPRSKVPMITSYAVVVVPATIRRFGEANRHEVDGDMGVCRTNFD